MNDREDAHRILPSQLIIISVDFRVKLINVVGVTIKQNDKD